MLKTSGQVQGILSPVGEKRVCNFVMRGKQTVHAQVLVII